MLVGEAIVAMTEYFEGSVPDIEHFLKVYGYAKAIGEAEKLDARTQYILEVASVVHDIGVRNAKRKYNSDAGKYQEELGPDEARVLLTGLGCEPDVVERVCFLVGHHHTYEGVDGVDYRIILEADFLVNAWNQKTSPEGIVHARDKFFRTKTGTELLNHCLLKQE